MQAHAIGSILELVGSPAPDDLGLRREPRGANDEHSLVVGDACELPLVVDPVAIAVVEDQDVAGEIDPGDACGELDEFAGIGRGLVAVHLVDDEVDHGQVEGVRGAGIRGHDKLCGARGRRVEHGGDRELAVGVGDEALGLPADGHLGSARELVAGDLEARPVGDHGIVHRADGESGAHGGEARGVGLGIDP